MLLAACGVMNSPVTLVPRLSASASETPRRQRSIRVNSRSSPSLDAGLSGSGNASAGPYVMPSSSVFFSSFLAWIRLMILYEPKAMTVTPTPTPAAMAN
ncbi:hypothetical protein KC337_g93 [Hortaea werneckii]|nr:hypothetical protein KC337_g93 [Hortaea werneckii]